MTMTVVSRLSRFRTLTMSVAATSTVLIGVAAAPALAFPTSPFEVTYGQTLTSGTLTWANRNVGIQGTDRATGGQCRATRLQTFTQSGALLGTTEPSLGEVCVAPGYPSLSYGFSGSAPANVAGGAQYVTVCLMGGTWSDPTSSYRPLRCQRVDRP
jgi:hypothetical protein